MNSAVKTLTVLETVAGAAQATRLGEIARLAELTKPTAHRILQTLAGAGYVLADGDGHYSVGPGLLGLAGRTLRSHEYGPHVGPPLRSLQESTGHTVHFALLAGGEAVYVEKVEPVQPYQMASRVGMRIPLHCTAIGKSILASLPEADARGRLGAEPYARRTPTTSVTWPDLARDLAQIRLRGYSIDDEENEANVRCVGAPVFDSRGRVCGAISASGLTFTFSRHDAQEAGVVVHEGAVAVSRALGAPPTAAHRG